MTKLINIFCVYLPLYVPSRQKIEDSISSSSSLLLILALKQIMFTVIKHHIFASMWLPPSPTIDIRVWFILL